MAENEVAARSSSTSRPRPRPRPTITLPPRENLFFDSTSFSPGPMTLVSSFFSDTGSQSFSQLLAGAMASPAAAATAGGYNLGLDAKLKESEGGDKSLGFKQNRPVNLLIASSPLFMIPPGLSPSGFLNSPGFFSSHSQLQSPFGMSHQQALAQVTAQAAISQSSNNQSPPGYQQTSSEPAESFISNSSGTTNVTAEQQIPMDSRSPVIESSEVRGYDSVKSQSTSIAVDKPASDGYNWRKYGQKQVKGSVFPRSYYKCTQLGCPVKKKVERSIEGQIIEIIYKGQHNHELPRSNGRGKDCENSHMKGNAQIKPEIENHDNYSIDNKPAHLLMEGGHDSSTMTLQLVQRHGSEEATVKVDSKEESQCTGDEPNPKRRKSMQPAQKTVTESRIVVQTRSEVDLLDDGFKWRKYGQKVVKGNPYPRSYYKCTTPGCSVRKHVERAAADPKAVITTYEGKHTHDIPLGKHSSSHASQSNPVKTAAQQTLPITN